MPARTLTLYIDYKSPYAYLAKDPAYALERDTAVTIDWLPYTLTYPPISAAPRSTRRAR
jgi:2-hydroxychromene-2-carboxylate isomerase